MHPQPTAPAISSQIDRCEAILSTPGVTTIEWDPYVAGEDPTQHLAYLQRIAQREGFSLQLSQPTSAHVRAINHPRTQPTNAPVSGSAKVRVSVGFRSQILTIETEE